MNVYFNKDASNKFRRRARKTAPREEFGILMGELEGDSVLIHDIYFPPDRLEESTENNTAVCLDWFGDAETWAEGQGKPWIAVGDIHSHCYTKSKKNIPEHEPSEQDWKSTRVIHDSALSSYCVFGICRVIIGKNRKRATIKLWPLIPELNTTVIDNKEDEE